ncbi:CSEP0186 putative effector protein [Blumeria hordei DH14]|uniref:CSEP0186 putative effector protein n=1 Tax=Blumeria graminis f. sp. hordei (strain DH14) TaxID=546991 RepID=N1JQR1_BLUG1|nr:CSEP0186 putative effector protein [Blumeria hordei DH14]
MKCATFASITAILSFVTQAFAVKNYICNGERISCKTIRKNIDEHYDMIYSPESKDFHNPGRDESAFSTLQHVFGSNPLTATMAGIDHICHPEV